MPADSDRLYSLAELRTLVDVDELRGMLGRERGRRVSRPRATQVVVTKGFPDPLVDHPRLRLWLRADVEAWLDRNRPGWREPQ